MRQAELIERIKSYNPDSNEAIINQAYVFAMKAHGSQLRASGDPYFSHPIEVASILAEMRMDDASITTALLHDVVEDTLKTNKEIKKIFGKEVATLVDGVTKLSKIRVQSNQSEYAENFIKLVLAMSNDIRVVLVKLADRLHNMRTLNFLDSKEKRLRIAQETMEVYAPLAERMGMRDVCDELNEIAFEELNPDLHKTITRRFSLLRKEGKDSLDKTIKFINGLMKKAKINGKVLGREKMPYSICRKMASKEIDLEEISDIIAYRIIVENTEACYKALGLMHGEFSAVPGAFKDYISTPKPNGYRSIHTCVIGPEKKKIEIQIRDRKMDETAELGIATHWLYKQKLSPPDGKRFQWLSDLLDILENSSSPEEFLEHTKLNMFHDQVFCFTPKGKPIAMPKNATPVDFAYSVHTDVGNRCVGAKVNGKLVPLGTKLKNGDQVEIVCSKNYNISPAWENFVVSAKSKASIRRYIRTSQKKEFIDLGKEILKSTFSKHDMVFSGRKLKKIIGKFHCESVNDLFASVGGGLHRATEIINKLDPKKFRASKSRKFIRNLWNKNGKGKYIPIKGLELGSAIHFADCCCPIPGDRISGISVKGKGIVLHTFECGFLKRKKTKENIVEVAWEKDSALHGSYTTRLLVVLSNRAGSLGTLSTVIGKNMGNISNLKITSRARDFFNILVDVEVKNVKHLSEITVALRAMPTINSVSRIRGKEQ